jgi:hypothetical protein
MKHKITALIILVILIGTVKVASSKVSFPGISEPPDPTGQHVVL